MQYVRFSDDFPVIPISNVWTDTGTGSFTDEKVYVVQTGSKVIERCLLMATDPGDLVLDPTCEYVHLPSLDSLDQYQSQQWGRRPFWEGAKQEGQALLQALLEATARTFKPDAIIVDFLPMGKNEELFQLVDSMKAKKYFIIRGVLDTIDAVRSIVITKKGEYLLEHRYDRIFVTAEREVVDVAEEYELSDAIASKLIYTGYVADQFEAHERARARQERGVFRRE